MGLKQATTRQNIDALKSYQHLFRPTLHSLVIIYCNRLQVVLVMPFHNNNYET